ncbi:hypothetical protein LOD99_4387 [Oopsacas minuta]|uniref:Polynucleotide 5'-hydroxyl-kinase NOL9 n=1 Tax=Oopsacas minuta TaxID=111878 RepID=A0AAV7JUZ0_9METZ|nr:hypothetical protein LOD99_4387 [Oopsacas minuta]
METLKAIEGPQQSNENTDKITTPIHTPVMYIYGMNNSNVYMAFQEHSVLHFRGCIRLKVLYGSVKIHGTIINPDSTFHNLFSTTTHPTYISYNSMTYPYMGISTLEEFLFSSRINRSLGLPVEDAENILYKLSEVDNDIYLCLCTVKSLSTPLAYFTRKKFKNIFHAANTKPILPFFYPLKTANSLLTPEITENWEVLMEQISYEFSTKVMVVGSKGVGKSSYSVYLVNYLLNTHECVLFVECDPGQPEFIPTGNLGIQALRNGTIGPAYTHKVISDVQYFYGSSTPSCNPELYIRIITKMWEQIQQLDFNTNNIPVVVNTCGWVDGLGINLLSDLIYLFNPHILVAQYLRTTKDWLRKLTTWNINSNRIFTKNENPTPYTSEIIHTAPSPLHAINLTSDKCLVFQYKSFLSTISPTVKTPALLPSDLRTLNIISNFSRGFKIKSNFTYLEEMLFQCQLYELPISHCFYQKVSVEFPSSGLMDVINANIIGLGIANCESIVHENITVLSEEIRFLNPKDIYACVGLGFVRFIDEKRKMLFVTTPIKMKKLLRINLIMVGTNILSQSRLPIRELRNDSYYSMKVKESLNKGSKFRRPNKQIKTRKSIIAHKLHRPE